jgi:hypothetical protein
MCVDFSCLVGNLLVSQEKLRCMELVAYFYFKLHFIQLSPRLYTRQTAVAVCYLLSHVTVQPCRTPNLHIHTVLAVSK